jgi:hypothetical protein
VGSCNRSWENHRVLPADKKIRLADVFLEDRDELE